MRLEIPWIRLSPGLQRLYGLLEISLDLPVEGEIDIKPLAVTGVQPMLPGFLRALQSPAELTDAGVHATDSGMGRGKLRVDLDRPLKVRQGFQMSFRLHCLNPEAVCLQGVQRRCSGLGQRSRKAFSGGH